MSYDNIARAKRWFEEVWNQGRGEVIEELMAPDGIAHGLGDGGGDLHGVDGFKAFHAAYVGAFPDIRFEVDDVIAEGDRVAIRFHGSGTHSGGQLGLAPTGKAVSFTGMTFTRWKDGQIQEGWNNVDMLAIMQQIGAVKAVE
jgi:steroid delta-isomerase-like uncharacterized protein